MVVVHLLVVVHFWLLFTFGGFTFGGFTFGGFTLGYIFLCVPMLVAAAFEPIIAKFASASS